MTVAIPGPPARAGARRDAPHLSELDQARFGIVTVKAGAFDQVTDVADTLAFCAANRAQLLIARVDAEHVAVAHALEERGALLCDTLVFYRLPVVRARDQSNEHVSSIFVRDARPEDAASLTSIARTAFTGYLGHYHADPRLPRHACDEVYVSWCAAIHRGDDARSAVIVAEDANGVCGFLTIRNDGSTLELVLSGLARRVEGRGVYRRLVASGVDRAVTERCKAVVTSTQITNFAVQRVWVKQGFAMTGATHTFHLWFPS